MNPEVRHKVKQSHGLPANDGGGEVKSTENKSQAQVGISNVESLVGAEDSRGRLEMAHTEPAGVLALETALSGGCVDQEVRLPASELVEDKLEHLDGGDVLEQLWVHVQAGQSLLGSLLNGLGYKSHVFLHVPSETVVTVVAVLPREVRHEQRRVHEPAHEVVEPLVNGEGTVAALVSQNPNTGEDETLDVTVGDPGGGTQGRVGDLGDEL